MPPSRPRRGSYAVELALTLPFWLALVLGIVDTTWILQQRTQLAAALEAGCRDAALRDPGDQDVRLPELRDATLARLQDFLGKLDANPCTSCDVVVRIEGQAPHRRLVCTGTREGRALTARWFGALPLNASRSARLEWQQGSAP